MTPRELFEAQEARILSPRATLAMHSRGRLRPEEPCPIRSAFQRDRDRIIHSKAFRRLRDKTQVFVATEGDHFRTRLTHTLEVAQIARTMARALRLNEDLTEAIALGHDLGHTPFGHAGERVLARLHPDGFRHDKQSLRVVDILERPGGLNLTAEVRDGIANHTASGHPLTPEAALVHLSDRIAYVNHDIDDALRAGIITRADLPPGPVQTLGKSHSQRIGTLVQAVITHSQDGPVGMEETAAAALDTLRRFLFARVYVGSVAKREEEKAERLVETLYQWYLDHPDEEPGRSGHDGVRDYVAGMTDHYAIWQYERLFVPSPWRPE